MQPLQPARGSGVVGWEALPILLILHVHRSRNLPEKFKAAARKRLIDCKHQIRHLQIQKLKPLKEKWLAQDHIVNQWQSEG